MINRKRKMPAPVSGKKEDKSQCNRSTGGRGKHSVYKLYLGWQHFSSEKYRVVTVKKGGGTRLIEYKADEVQTVESIIRKGTQFFFPNRKSQLGDLDHMDLSLTSFSGESLETFTDIEGKECTLQMYLKSHGLFSSQYHLYLRTKRRGESSESPKKSEEAPDLLKQPKEANSLNEDEGHLEKCEKVLLVNNEVPGKIKLSFRKTVLSTYSNNESSISCASMKTCYGLAAHHKTPYEQYNCLVDDGFLTTFVSKDDRMYLTQLDDRSYQLQDYTTVRGSDVIMYGPNEIYGMNEGDLMLGLIAVVHNQNMLYQWFKDGELHYEGLNVSFIKVETPGVYSAVIYSGGQMHVYEDKCIVKECFLKKDAAEPENQSLFTSDLVEQLPSPSECPTQLPTVSGLSTQLSVPSEPTTQLPTVSESTTALSGPTTQLPVTSGPTTQTPATSEPTSQLPALTGPTTQLPALTVLPKQLPTLSQQTDVNEMECTCLPKVSITDLSFGEEIGRGHLES